MTKPPQRGRLPGIEAIRGAAASMVVLYHCARHLDQVTPVPALMRTVQCGHAGVDLFFVLSGFIILFVHAKDVGRPDRAWHYAGRRFSRVMPTYWVALAISVAMSVAAHHDPPTLGRLLVSAALLPADRQPLLGVAWTLQYEMSFYALFLVLVCNLRAGRMLLAIWAAAIVAMLFVPPMRVPAWFCLVCGAYNLEFLFGMAVAWHALHGTLARPGMVTAVGLCLLTACGTAEDMGWIDGYARGARLLYGIPAAMLIAGVVGLDTSRALRPSRLLRVLGSASYSIYLFQFVCIGIMWKALLATRLAQSLPPWVSFAVLATAAVAGGVMAAACVERPLLRLVRHGVAATRRLSPVESKVG